MQTQTMPRDVTRNHIEAEDSLRQERNELQRSLDAINQSLRESERLVHSVESDRAAWKAHSAKMEKRMGLIMAKRHRSTLLARQRGRNMVAVYDVARARLDELQADLAKARQAPTYFDDTGMERTDAAAVAFEQGRHALDKAESLERTVEGAKAVAVRQQRAIEALADELETMTARAIKAERALAAVEARANGHPPAVRSVGVNFRLAS